MRIATKSLGLSFGLTIVFSFSPLALAADDAIIAVVNDQIITLGEFQEYLHSIYMQLLAEGRDMEDIHKIMIDYEISGLDQLIDDKLLVDEANKNGLQIRTQVIDEKINAIKNKYPAEQEFLDALAASGLTLTDLRNKITDQYKAKYIVEMEVRRKIYVNPQEVTDYYREHFKEFQDPEKVELGSIFVALGEDQEKSRQRVYEALKRIQAGKDFEGVAKEFSETPSIGIVEKGQVLPALENIIFQLKENEISPVVAAQDGLYIFRLKKKFPAEVRTLEEVKADIHDLLFEKKFRQELKKWIEDLRENAYVEIKK